ncbi:uncharacterized protein HaLaN_23297, partial [Haematococcus lacustris]
MDEPGAAAAMQSAEARAEQDNAALCAGRTAELAAELAVSRGVTRTKITTKVLQPQGGSSDAGSALVAYAHDKAVNVVVVGSRGLGAVQRQLMNLVGLGSVSEYLAHNLHCALAVVHPREEDGSGGGDKGLSGFGARGSTGDNVSFQVIPETAEEAAE